MEFARPLDGNLEDPQPSFFDLLAQSNFDRLLQPLFEPVLAPQFPSTHRKIFYTLKAAVDLGMVAGFGGIASEVFYGLERHASSNKNILLYLVTLLECHLFPLLKTNSRIASLVPQSLGKILKFLDVLVKLAYITGDTKSFSLLHFITGITYKHSSTTIYNRTDALGKIAKSILISGQLLVYLIQSGVFDKLKARNHRFKNQVISSVAPDIEELTPKPHPHGYPAPPRAGICPLCSSEWNNPVVLSSGYIFCQKCIKSDLQYCPVTRLKISRIVPLFLQ